MYEERKINECDTILSDPLWRTVLLQRREVFSLHGRYFEYKGETNTYEVQQGPEVEVIEMNRPLGCLTWNNAFGETYSSWDRSCDIS